MNRTASFKFLLSTRLGVFILAKFINNWPKEINIILKNKYLKFKGQRTKLIEIGQY